VWAARLVPSPAAVSPPGVTPLVRCVLAALVLTVAVAAPVGASAAAPNPAQREAPAGSIGLRLVDTPATAGKDPRAQVYIVDHLAPGTAIRRRIEISNTTDSTAHIVLYPAAAAISNGTFLGAPGHTANDLSTWTSVRPGAIDVSAGALITATVTIAVPRDAAPGEQYGVVWAEARSAPSTGDGVVQVSRVGIRLYISVGPGGPPAANFTIDSLTADRSPDGRPMVLATVHNTGGRALDMSGTLRLMGGPGELSAGPFPVTLGTTLAVGDMGPVTIALDKQLPAGPWDARITLRSGLLERDERATITFPDTTSPTSTRPGWLYPAIAGLVVVLLAIAAPFVVPRWPRRPRRRSPVA
jgi:hypothetical protein